MNNPLEGLIEEVESGAEHRPDFVNHPPHYTKGGIECIEAIRASMTDDGFKAYLKGNIMKYLWRYEHKNGVQDLQKAQWYLNELIMMLQESS